MPADHDKGVKFLYDKIHRLDSSFVAARAAGGMVKEPTKVIRIWIKRKRANKIKWDTNGNTLVNKPLAVYCIPYEQYDTATTSRVATMAGFMRMYYKDV